MVLTTRIEPATKTQIFPPWFDVLAKGLPVLAGLGGVHLLVVLYLGFSPQTTDVGYQPVQPIPYSHRRHAGELGLDCRYCHNTVEVSAHASIPPAHTCWNCHENIHTELPALKPLREIMGTGDPAKNDPIEWVRIHDLSDFAYFNHSAHVTRGVGCVTCHGRIDRMDVVFQDQKLSMGWCLDCHRNPEPNLRPKDQITNMEWKAELYVPAAGDAELIGLKPADLPLPMTQEILGAILRKKYDINPSESCSTCHR